LVVGTLFFLLIALTLAPRGRPPASPLPISLTLIAVAFAGVGLIARAVVLPSIVTKARGKLVNESAPSKDGGSGDAKYLLSVFQTKTIISGGLFEGWAFLATIAYLVEGNPIAFALAILLILGLAAHLPTPSRAIAWVERQLEKVEQEKSFR
jgi:hypothetical protein